MKCGESWDEDGYCLKCGSKYHCITCGQALANMYASGHRCNRRAKTQPGIWVHGMPASSLEQVESFLSGDAHDQSKVQWFDGIRFYDLKIVRD